MDRRQFLVGASTTVGAFTLLGQAPGCEPGPIAGEGYTLVWSDEFDTLDTAVWQPEPWYASVFDWSKVSVVNSVLTLTADLTPSPPHREFTTLASVGPRAAARPFHPQAKAWQEGYFEIRARCTNDPWAKLALWFMSHESANCWPDQRDCTILNAEWDMVENGVRTTFAGPSAYADVNNVSVLHRNTSNPCGIQDTSRVFSKDFPGGGLSDWHVWSGKWTAAELTTYLDGQVLGTQATYPDSTGQPMYMLLTAAACMRVDSPPPGHPPPPETLETQIDWVRVWQK
jgi:beta-glucanase (GH16 family)